jgi:predicted RNase H-like nuclease (RuvC/YqgF family)
MSESVTPPVPTATDPKKITSVNQISRTDLIQLVQKLQKNTKILSNKINHFEQENNELKVKIEQATTQSEEQKLTIGTEQEQLKKLIEELQIKNTKLESELGKEIYSFYIENMRFMKYFHLIY